MNLAGIRILFELEEHLGARILEALYAEGTGDAERRPTREADPGIRSIHPTRSIDGRPLTDRSSTHPSSGPRPADPGPDTQENLDGKATVDPGRGAGNRTDRITGLATCRSSPSGRPSSSRR